MRQDYREVLPRFIASKFSRRITKREWRQLHLGLGRTDVAALAKMSFASIRRILADPDVLGAETLTAEERLRVLAPRHARDYLKKADELATFMVTGRIDPANHGFLKNADSIALLLDGKGRKTGDPDPDLVEAIDELTTLYALGKLDGGTRALMRELAEQEGEGMDFLVGYLSALRSQEREKAAATPAARLNAWKGHIPAEARDGARLVVRDDSEHDRLVALGYTWLGDYRGPRLGRKKLGYYFYFSTVAGNATYNQGVMQTVSTSYFGIDPRTASR